MESVVGNSGVVYTIKHEDGIGPSRTVHRNLLMLCAQLLVHKQPDYKVKSSTPRHSIPRGNTKNVKLQPPPPAVPNISEEEDELHEFQGFPASEFTHRISQGDVIASMDSNTPAELGNISVAHNSGVTPMEPQPNDPKDIGSSHNEPVLDHDGLEEPGNTDSDQSDLETMQ